MDRLSSIASGIVQMVWGRREYGFFTVLVVATICERIGRVGREMQKLAAAFEAGTLRTRRSPPPGLTRSKPAPPSATPDPMKLVLVPLPRRFGWLARLHGEVRPYGCQLEDLLNEPEMQALMAASPRAVRAIRPLCRMLGIATPKPTAPVPPVKPVPPTPPQVEEVPDAAAAGPYAEAPPLAGSRDAFGGRPATIRKIRGLERAGFARPFRYD